MTDIRSVKLLLDSIYLAVENPFFNMVQPGVDAGYFGRKLKEAYQNHSLSYLQFSDMVTKISAVVGQTATNKISNKSSIEHGLDISSLRITEQEKTIVRKVAGYIPYTLKKHYRCCCKATLESS